MAEHISEHAEAVLEHDGHGGHDEHEEHHYTPTLHFAGVFVVLMVLLLATVGASYVDLHKFIPIPGLNIIVMLAIAILKAAAVVLIFMEVRKGSKLLWLWAAMGFVWLPTMLGIVMDYMSRNYIAKPW